MKSRGFSDCTAVFPLHVNFEANENTVCGTKTVSLGSKSRPRKQNKSTAMKPQKTEEVVRLLSGKQLFWFYVKQGFWLISDILNGFLTLVCPGGKWPTHPSGVI